MNNSKRSFEIKSYLKRLFGGKVKNPKKLVTVIAIVLVLAVTAGVTVAYLIDKSDRLENVFQTVSDPPEVVETIENNIKTSEKIKNNGDIPAYIRVAVVGNQLGLTAETKSDITGAADVSGNLKVLETPTEDDLKNGCWFTDGRYYYWSLPVRGAAEDPAPEEENTLTGELILSPITLYAEDGEGNIQTNIQVTTLTETMQSDGVENDVAEGQSERRHPVTSAWGVEVAEDGHLIAPTT